MSSPSSRGSPIAQVMERYLSTHHQSTTRTQQRGHRSTVRERLVFAPVLVIGQQKSASTLLYSILSALLGLEPSNHLKELNWFTFPKSCVSYPTRCHHSLAPYSRRAAWRPGRQPVRVLLDGTPDYFTDALAFAQIHATLPQARLLLVVRDPLERAHSAWLQNAREGADPRPFDTAVREELADLWRRCAPPRVRQHAARLPPMPRAEALASYIAENASSWYVHDGRRGAAWEIRLVRALARGGGAHDDPFHDHHAAECLAPWHDTWLKWGRERCGSCKHYLARGLVARKLQVWREAYGAQLLVVTTEALIAQTTKETSALAAQLLDFLRLPTAAPNAEVLAHIRGLARVRCWHPPCKSSSRGSLDGGPTDGGPTDARDALGAEPSEGPQGRITPEMEAALIAFYTRDQAELRALDSRLLWPSRWSGLPPRQPPPLSGQITELLTQLHGTHRQQR